MSRLPCGVYVLTHHHDHDDKTLVRDVAAAIAGGAVMIQYRDKSGDPERQWRQAALLVDLCGEHDVPLIINDDPDLCLAVGADGVHVGREDGDITATRDRLGPGVILGASCYNEAARAEAAARAGADYLAFGSVFPSPTKPDAVHAPLSLLGDASRQHRRPTCAIGGITAGNIARVAGAGAALAAVIGAVWEGDPQANVARLSTEFDRGRAGD